MIILTLFYFEDVAYGMYYTVDRIYIDSEYGCDVYAKALEKYHQKRHRTNIQSCVCRVRKQDTFLMLWNNNKDTTKTFFRLVTYVKRLCTNMCSSFFTTHRQNKTSKFIIEGLYPSQV